MNLQSGFVLAVLVALVVFADRLGGQREVARRMFQIALGAALAFTVAAGTVALVEPDREEGASLFDSAITTGDEDDQLTLQEVSDRSVVANTIRFGAGIVILLFGLGGLSRWNTLPLGVTFGGLLLLFAGGGGNELFGFANLISASASSSREIDLLYFVVLLVGLGALFWYGNNEWESAATEQRDANDALDEADA